MNEEDVRALVREAIERHLGRPHPGNSTIPIPIPIPMPNRHVPGGNVSTSHPSHILLNVLPGSEADDGMCVIEPRVRCNHCGFCQSYGH